VKRDGKTDLDQSKPKKGLECELPTHRQTINEQVVEKKKRKTTIETPTTFQKPNRYPWRSEEWLDSFTSWVTYVGSRLDILRERKERLGTKTEKALQAYSRQQESSEWVALSPDSQGFYPRAQMNRGGLSPVLFSLQSPEPMIGNKRRKNNSLLSSISCISPHL
jgi:hypothetical protein